MTAVVRGARTSLLIAPVDPIPVGARFVETRFRDPEGEWHPAIPGATLATLYNGVLAAHPQPDTGRFPLPDDDALRATLDEWHIDADTPVIVYAVDPHDTKTAARGWFVLRNVGIRDVRVLDGGAAAWAERAADAGGAAPVDDAPVGVAPVGVAPVDAVPAQPHGVTVIDDVRAGEIGRAGTLLDARPAFAYVEGHIPGATCAPSDVLFPDGHLIADVDLQAWADRVGATGDGPVAAYCGGGVAGAAAVFALATVGIDVPLYVGSWSQWSRLPGHPVAR